VLEALRGPAADALRLIRALEREGCAAPGARLTARCSISMAQAARPYEAALADRLGRRFEILPQDGWPAGRMEVSAQ
jgi:hypothetical protein